VVVDKPLAPTAVEAQSLVEQAEGLGVLITAYIG
jgi:predicted dehydrogenase